MRSKSFHFSPFSLPSIFIFSEFEKILSVNRQYTANASSIDE